MPSVTVALIFKQLLIICFFTPETLWMKELAFCAKYLKLIVRY